MSISVAESPLNTYSNVAVIGAAGKMGSGISLLLLQEVSLCCIAQNSSKTHFCLTLIDANPERLDGLRKYLQTHLQKWAEKNIITLRETVAHIPTLISNREIIETFLAKAMEIAHFSCALTAASHSQLIFEAILESVDAKIETLSALKKLSVASPYFLSNTSSIPISVMNEKAALDNKIIGFHLYNPPGIQKLIEIIPLDHGDPALTTVATQLAARLGKTVIFSKDVAGFIGNGYFLREILEACQKVEELAKHHGVLQSVYMINKVTQDFLLRPMGIFQLVDYVGLDVIANIKKIMEQYLDTPFYSIEFLRPLFAVGKIGGQFSDGSQKDGFFHYVNGEIEGVFDPATGNYCNLATAPWKKECDVWLGSPPMGLSWKMLSKDPKNSEKIQAYFVALTQEKSPGAQVAIRFIAHLQKIREELVEDGISATLEDVDQVLEKGFYHLYSAKEVFVTQSPH